MRNMYKKIILIFACIALSLPYLAAGAERTYTINSTFENVVSKIKQLEARPPSRNPLIPDEVKEILNDVDLQIGGNIYHHRKVYEGHIHLLSPYEIVPFFNLVILDELDKTIFIQRINSKQLRVTTTCNIWLRQNDRPFFIRPNSPLRIINRIKNRKTAQIEWKILEIEEQKLRAFLEQQ